MNKLQANQFDIIRSYSKDKFYRSKQALVFKSLLEYFIKKQNLLKYNNEIELFSDLFYYCTTLLNKQTIGQEYFNLIYFNSKTVKSLAKLDRIQLLSLKLIAPYLINFAIRSQSLNPEFKIAIGYLKIFLVFAERINRIIFLFASPFYNLENLLTSTKIISLNIIDKTKIESLKTLKMIGLIKTLTLLIQIFNESKFLSKKFFEINETVNSNTFAFGPSENKSIKIPPCDNLTCLLCLDKISEPTSAMCGHIFCYTCIQAFVNNSKKNSSQTTCPSCRMVIHENKLIYLHNF